MDKDFFERKIKELEDDKLLDLLRIKNSANQEIIQFATEEAKRRNLKIDLSQSIAFDSNTILHKEIENGNKLKKWNWGAFTLAPIWILANKLNAWWFIIFFIPVVNIVVLFYLGYNGNRLAYFKSGFESVDDFLAVQKEWNKWGIRLFWLLIISSVIKIIVEVISG